MLTNGASLQEWLYWKVLALYCTPPYCALFIHATASVGVLSEDAGESDLGKCVCVCVCVCPQALTMGLGLQGLRRWTDENVWCQLWASVINTVRVSVSEKCSDYTSNTNPRTNLWENTGVHGSINQFAHIAVTHQYSQIYCCLARQMIVINSVFGAKRTINVTQILHLKCFLL